jgi:hypothetical protein
MIGGHSMNSIVRRSTPLYREVACPYSNFSAWNLMGVDVLAPGTTVRFRRPWETTGQGGDENR